MRVCWLSISQGANRSRAACSPPMCFQCFVPQPLTELNTHTGEQLNSRVQSLLYFIFVQVNKTKKLHAPLFPT